jgi:hypothetical protein
MKHLLTLLLFISTSAMAETWFCAATLEDFNQPDVVESKVYKREGSGFTKISTISGESKMEILNENTKFVALAETFNYPSVFITFLYKDTRAFYENYIDSKGNESKPLNGSCYIVDDMRKL